MTRRILMGIGVLLLVSSANAAVGNDLLPGSLWQFQSFTVGDVANPGMVSILTLTHGDVDAFAKQTVNVDNTNSAPAASQGGNGVLLPSYPGHIGCPSDDGCDTTGQQTQTGDIKQWSKANGNCGVVNVQSFLGADGTQDQVIGFSTSGAWQTQTLGVGATQALTRQDGAGRGLAVNSANLEQGQTGENAAGTYGESSTLNVRQTAGVTGKALSHGSVVTDLVAQTGQQQIVY